MARFGIETCTRTAFTMNLSRGGVFLRTNQVHKPGTRLQLELSSGDQKKQLSAQVKWAKCVPPSMAHVELCGMGVEFVDCGPAWDEFFDRWKARGAVPSMKK